MRIRYLIEALLFGLIVCEAFFGGLLLDGYIRTITYVPDIAEKYESVEYLQREVAFGIVYTPHWLVPAGGFIAVVTLYYLARVWMAERLAAKRG